MKKVRYQPSKGASLSLLWPAIVGGGALFWLLPVACSLDSEGRDVSGGQGSTTVSASSATGSGAGGGGASGAASSSSAGTGVGGAGGEGTGGAGGAGGSGGAGPVAHAWQAETPVVLANKTCVENYTYNLPADWLQFSSPSADDRTSQIAIDKLCKGFKKDMARARNVGTEWGLSIESTRKNLIKNSDSWGVVQAGWGPGNMAVTSSQSDPAGGQNATLFLSPESAMGNYSNYSAPPVASQVASSWLKGGVGVAPYAHFRHWNMGYSVEVDTIGWKRYSVTQTSMQNAEVALETRDMPPGAGVIAKQTSVFAFGAQAEENALYPSSYIPTMDNVITRPAETLSSVPGKLPELAPSGYFDITLKFAPNFAVNDMVNELSAMEYNVLYFDGKHRVYLRKSDRKFVMEIADKDVASDQVSFEREQELTIRATNLEGKGFQLKVEGATPGAGTYNGDTEGAVKTDAGSIVVLLGGPNGAEECADLRFVKFDVVNR